MPEKMIEVTCSESIYEITLNRPERRNPLSVGMIAQLTTAFNEIKHSQALGIILGAEGPVFSAGHDFNDMLDQELAEMRELMLACSELMQLIQTVPQPVAAKVQGPAIGAGCQLALSCDLVVASEKARSIWARLLTGAKPRVSSEEPLNKKASYQGWTPSA